jgi:hypothetical protein
VVDVECAVGGEAVGEVQAVTGGGCVERGQWEIWRRTIKRGTYK